MQQINSKGQAFSCFYFYSLTIAIFVKMYFTASLRKLNIINSIFLSIVTGSNILSTLKRELELFYIDFNKIAVVNLYYKKGFLFKYVFKKWSKKNCIKNRKRFKEYSLQRLTSYHIKQKPLSLRKWTQKSAY